MVTKKKYLGQTISTAFGADREAVFILATMQRFNSALFNFHRMLEPKSAAYVAFIYKPLDIWC